MSKQDYNFQVLLLLCAMLGVGALGALIMFLTLIT